MCHLTQEAFTPQNLDTSSRWSCRHGRGARGWGCAQALEHLLQSNTAQHSERQGGPRGGGTTQWRSQAVKLYWARSAALRYGGAASAAAPWGCREPEQREGKPVSSLSNVLCSRCPQLAPGALPITPASASVFLLQACRAVTEASCGRACPPSAVTDMRCPGRPAGLQTWRCAGRQRPGAAAERVAACGRVLVSSGRRRPNPPGSLCRQAALRGVRAARARRGARAAGGAGAGGAGGGSDEQDAAAGAQRRGVPGGSQPGARRRGGAEEEGGAGEHQGGLQPAEVQPAARGAWRGPTQLRVWPADALPVRSRRGTPSCWCC